MGEPRAAITLSFFSDESISVAREVPMCLQRRSESDQSGASSADQERRGGTTHHATEHRRFAGFQPPALAGARPPTGAAERWRQSPV
jgi:hypothetical protein